jgi:hypothetical protein
MGVTKAQEVYALEQSIHKAKRAITDDPLKHLQDFQAAIQTLKKRGGGDMWVDTEKIRTIYSENVNEDSIQLQLATQRFADEEEFMAFVVPLINVLHRRWLENQALGNKPTAQKATPQQGRKTGYRKWDKTDVDKGDNGKPAYEKGSQRDYCEKSGHSSHDCWRRMEDKLAERDSVRQQRGPQGHREDRRRDNRSGQPPFPQRLPQRQYNVEHHQYSGEQRQSNGEQRQYNGEQRQYNGEQRQGPLRQGPSNRQAAQGPLRGPGGTPFNPSRNQQVPHRSAANMGYVDGSYYEDDSHAAIIENDSYGEGEPHAGIVISQNACDSKATGSGGDLAFTNDGGTNRMVCSQGWIQAWGIEDYAIVEPINLVLETVGGQIRCKKQITFQAHLKMRNKASGEVKTRGIVFRRVLVTDSDVPLGPLFDLNTFRTLKGSYTWKGEMEIVLPLTGETMVLQWQKHPITGLDVLPIERISKPQITSMAELLKHKWHVANAAGLRRNPIRPAHPGSTTTSTAGPRAPVRTSNRFSPLQEPQAAKAPAPRQGNGQAPAFVGAAKKSLAAHYMSVIPNPPVAALPRGHPKLNVSLMTLSQRSRVSSQKASVARSPSTHSDDHSLLHQALMAIGDLDNAADYPPPQLLKHVAAYAVLKPVQKPPRWPVNSKSSQTIRLGTTV